MTADVLAVIVGLVLLALSGDRFVIGVGRLAAAVDMRPLVVGALIGGLGGSLPELFVAGVASARGEQSLAVGSLVGSVLVNVSLGLAVAALIAPVRVDSRSLRREIPLSVAAVLLFAWTLHRGLSVTDGVVMTAAIPMVVAPIMLGARRSFAKPDPSAELVLEVAEFFERPARRGAEVARTLAALAVMLGGAELLVRGASGLAMRMGIGQGSMGVSLVGIGTSAPIVAIAVQAARRGDHDLVVGNVIGSNLFIALAGGALVAFLGDGFVASIGAPAVWVMASVVVASGVLMARGGVLTRPEAGALIVVYLATLPFIAK